MGKTLAEKRYGGGRSRILARIPVRREMSIRQSLSSLRGRESGDRAELSLTAAAEAGIRERIAETGGEAVFFVATQPSRLGFNVAVGFEHPDADSGRRLFPELPVPIRISEEDWHRLRGYTIDYREGRFVTLTDVSVHVSETPNPQSRKFLLNRTLLTEGGASFHRPPQEDDPPLVQFLFDLPGIRSLFFMESFCTVTREEETPWDDLESEVGNRLQAYIAHGGVPLTPSPADPDRLGDVERRIVELLDDVVRPAVQKDGGDILFAGFDDGLVQLYMKGSCVGCPSSMATLKLGVENLLRDAIPEVREVIAID
jgi:Fe-S cluster biogenesis protein NfuA